MNLNLGSSDAFAYERSVGRYGFKSPNVVIRRLWGGWEVGLKPENYEENANRITGRLRNKIELEFREEFKTYEEARVYADSLYQ